MALAGLFAALGAVLRNLGAANVTVGVAWWLSGINLLLGLFNLLPGAPLDGGRVLSAYLWSRHGDKVRGEIGATRGGRIVGYVLIALGLFEFMVASIVTGVWTVFIGWFLLTAAHSEERRILTRQSLAGVRVADAMTAHPRTAPGGITVEDFIHSYLLGDRHSAYPVEGPSGTIAGTDHAGAIAAGTPRGTQIHPGARCRNANGSSRHCHPTRAAYRFARAAGVTQRKSSAGGGSRRGGGHRHRKRHQQIDRRPRARHNATS